jgi:hypothetical protein
MVLPENGFARKSVQILNPEPAEKLRERREYKRMSV